jgi:virulence factor Mce-like protein
METRPPTVGRVLVAIGFALSCFGLLLFLWLAFGGPTPLNPEGYRFTVSVDEATQLAQESDVRISGVSVGKVKRIELGDDGRAEATVELDATYAPIPSDTRAVLRQKTLLGETYVELTPGSQEAEPLPEGGELAEAQVSDAVQLDEIFRAFDEETRAQFQAWMQGQAAAFRGRGDDFAMAIASLDPFAESAERALRLLDSEEQAVTRLIDDGGEVFAALSERQGQLRGLVEASDQVFATTAARNADLEEIFRIFPTFLRESRATLTRLDEFATETDPLVQQLRPAAQELSPTLIDLGRLAPDLERFLLGLDRAIKARDGLPATTRLVDDGLRPLLERTDPYFAEINALLTVIRQYRREVTAFLGNVAAATNGRLNEGGDVFKHLRTGAPLAPQALASFAERLTMSRTNPYFAPGGYMDLLAGLDSFETRHCAGGVNAEIDPGDAGALPVGLMANLQQFAYNNETFSDQVDAPACNEQVDIGSVGVSPEQTKYQHVRRLP